MDYFAARGHEVVPSSSLVPGDDPTLLFTNSGMVQFKEVFLGQQLRSVPRAVTAQRCVRAGGKHNDLENVGYTARHHTFFEMLGNFSFGDYFKAEAIHYAWEVLTKEFGLPPERLWVTVFEEDDEAAKIWLNDIGVPAARLSRIGARDNFWSMGDSGPCGPCSEVFYDHGPEVAGGPPGSAQQDGDRFVEIWNLVFMQFNRGRDGKLEPLPKPSVDTGLGLERIAAILQGVQSNYEIDLFRNLIQAAAAVLGVDDEGDQSLRVIADHIRSTAFLLVDGVTPSNEGRGYVVRRIIRRAVRHGYRLGCREPFMHKLVQPLIDEMGEAYPELLANGEQVERVLQRENEKFTETLTQGLKILDREIAAFSDASKQTKTISGEAAFRLYDTFGFPLDLTADVAREHGLQVDTAAFEQAMAKQRQRARAASQFVQSGPLTVDGVGASRFVGYQGLQSDTRVVALLAKPSSDSQAEAPGKQPVAHSAAAKLNQLSPLSQLSEGQRGIVVLEHTPFYAESGGQVGDRGEIRFQNAAFRVSDTRYLSNKVIAHLGAVTRGRIDDGDRATAQVDAGFRSDCANNHSATHLLHAALKAVLGSHVQQKGSLVEAPRLRFDFSHSAAVGKHALLQIEQRVNQNIRANTSVTAATMDLEQAKADGAEALFGEKYDAQVRVIRMGEFSFELCGGTHVQRSGDIGLLKIISESGVAAGVRRIEAVTGRYAEQWVAQHLALLDSAAAVFKSPPEHLAQRLKTTLDEQRQQQKQIETLQKKLLAATSTAAEQVEEINRIKVVAIRQDQADAKAMRMTVDQWKRQLGSCIVFVAGVTANKVLMIAGVTSDLALRYHAGKLIQALAPLVDGQGGGKAELAQGGGGKINSVEQVMVAMKRWVAEVAP